MKDYMSKLGKSLMMPIPLIAAAGIFLGLASVLQNPNIVGQGFVDLAAVQNVIGFIKAIISAVFSNLPVLFALSITIGFAKAEKANAAFAGLIGFILFHVVIQFMLSLKGITAATYSVDALVQSGKTVLAANRTAALYESVLGIFTYRMSVFGGVIVGLAVAAIHNRFYKTQMPMAISYFSGKRLVPIMVTLLIPFLALAMFFIWPFFGAAIQALGGVIEASGAFGVFLFGGLERLLIPTGLHNILNQLVRFTPVGGVAQLDGTQYVGALNIFNQLLADNAPVNATMRQATQFLAQGKIPYMVFGLPAAALAMYRTARPSQKKRVAALLSAAALTSFTTGITEPIEFLFMFISPLLYIFHAFMGGLSFMLNSLLGVAIGNVQGGVIDLTVFGVLRGLDTRWYFEILIGIGYAFAYYFVFKKVIEWRNLKTPGREDLDAQPVEVVTETTNLPTDELSAKIVAGLGGVDNLEIIDNCFTRLRLTLKDANKIDPEQLKATGASGVVKVSDTAVQVVYGPQVDVISTNLKDFTGKD